MRFYKLANYFPKNYTVASSANIFHVTRMLLFPRFSLQVFQFYYISRDSAYNSLTIRSCVHVVRESRGRVLAFSVGRRQLAHRARLSIADLRGGSPPAPLCLYPIPSLKIIFFTFLRRWGGRVRRDATRRDAAYAPRTARTRGRARARTRDKTDDKTDCHVPRTRAISEGEALA